MVQTALSNDFWSDVIITAAGDNEAFDDVKIVTLRSYWTDQICDAIVGRIGLVNNPTDLAKHATTWIQSHPPTTMHEQVTISDNGIEVVLDVDEVDDAAVFEAMRAISQAMETLDGQHGTAVVGTSRVMTPVDFLSSELYSE